MQSEMIADLGSGRAVLVVHSGFEPAESCIDRNLRQALRTHVDFDTGDLDIEQVIASLWRIAPNDYVTAVQACETGFEHLLHRGPWLRVYDLSMSGSPTDSLLKTMPLGSLEIRKGPDGPATMTAGALQVISLFGRPSDDKWRPPLYKFAREEDLSFWHDRLAADAALRPVFFVADRFSELAGNMPDNRPSNARWWAVGELDSSTEAKYRLAGFSVADISVNDFFLLASGSSVEITDGRRSLARLRAAARQGPEGVRPVQALLTDLPGPERAFLEGQDPSWSDIRHPDFVERSVVEEILNEIDRLNAEKRPGTLALRGPAGSGKTGVLKSVGMRLAERGTSVGWIDRSYSLGISEIRTQALDQGLEVLLIDDIDMFGESSGQVADQFMRSGSCILVCCVRTVRSQLIPSSAVSSWIEVGGLHRDERNRLAATLFEAGRISGVDSVQSIGAAEHLLEQISREGDLLALLVRVVTGQDLSSRVVSEYESLAERGTEFHTNLQSLYGVVCLLSSFVFESDGTPADDLIMMFPSASTTGDVAQAIHNLVEHRLLREAEFDPNRIRSRHREIAEIVVHKCLPKERRAELVAMALKYYAGLTMDRFGRESISHRRVFERLISHSGLKALKLTGPQVRAIYRSIEDVANDSFHYWLQRAAFEIEATDGNLGRAWQLNRTAHDRPLGGADYLVRTQAAVISFKRSIGSPDDSELTALAGKHLLDLIDIAKAAGATSPHTYHALGREAVDWMETQSELPRGLAEECLRRFQAGARVCRGNRFLQEIAPSAVTRLERLIGGDTDGSPFVT